MDIRQAVDADAERINTLCSQLGYASSLAQTEQNLARLMSSKQDQVWVADLCGLVVGVVVIHQMFVLQDTRPYGRVSALVIDDSFRAMSIGSKLLEVAEARFKELGCLRVEVTTQLSREDAHGFYLHCGYRITPSRFVKLLVNHKPIQVIA